LTNSKTNSVYPSILRLINFPPKFISPLKNQSMGLSKTLTYQLPLISSYNSCPVKISLATSYFLLPALTIKLNKELIAKPTKF
jgi:hypothetical protein